MPTDNTDTVEDRTVPDSEFTGRIIGLLFQVHNAVGPGYQEKYYQRAFERQLEEANIPYKRELHFPIKFKEKSIGRYFVDFLIDDQLVVELKVSETIRLHYFKQVLGYLRHSGVKLGLIACFGEKGVALKRVIT